MRPIGGRSFDWPTRVLHVLNRTEGSFTLEASLVVPLLLVVLLSIICMSVFIYGQTVLYETATRTAERTAYSWNNSSQDWVTGLAIAGNEDGLYWRTGSDALSGMFAMGSDRGTVRVERGQDGAAGVSTLPQTKLLRALEHVPAQMVPALSYRHGLVDRAVQVQLQESGYLPLLAGSWRDSDRHASVQSLVTDPVELIRNVELARTYIVRIKDKLKSASIKDDVPAANPDNGPPARAVFASEKEAAAYLRQLVHGREVTVETPSERTRMLNALDPDGLFHEVKYGYTSRSEAVRNQIEKDLELLRDGSAVKGVVWHFFRSSKTGKVGPSKPLREELEKRGILVVIHP